MKVLAVVLGSFVLLSSSCFRVGTVENKDVNNKNGIGYHFNTIDTTFNLDRQLVEISGLSYSERYNALVAVNDEKAIVYYLNKDDGSIINKVAFGKPGDYEGIAVHDSSIYAVESNGNIKVIDEKQAKKVNEYNEALSSRHDIEGLVYNPFSETILLAAKGISQIGENDASKKSIFTMDMSNGRIDDAAYISIEISSLLQNFVKNASQDSARINKERRKRLKLFAPSGIAIHPSSMDVYVLSSKGKSLIIMSQSGTLKTISFLDRKIHPQPEGICFDPAGNLYISNEGKSKAAKLHVYSSQ